MVFEQKNKKRQKKEREGNSKQPGAVILHEYSWGAETDWEGGESYGMAKGHNQTFYHMLITQLLSLQFI